MIVGILIGLLSGLLIGAGGCWMLLRRLHSLVVNESEAERIKVRSEGLEAAYRIAEAGREVERKLYSQALETSEQPS